MHIYFNQIIKFTSIVELDLGRVMAAAVYNIGKYGGTYIRWHTYCANDRTPLQGKSCKIKFDKVFKRLISTNFHSSE